MSEGSEAAGTDYSIELAELPQTIGAAGLIGRTKIVRIPDEYEQPDGFDPETGDPIWGAPRAVGKAMPPNCLRVLNSPLPLDRGGGCSIDCPGKQRDGGCLCDIVRVANAQGIDWKFEVDPRDNSWIYAGPDLAGVEALDPRAAPEPEEHVFVCPHCSREVRRELGNWWCSWDGCGKNANDAVVPA